MGVFIHKIDAGCKIRSMTCELTFTLAIEFDGDFFVDVFAQVEDVFLLWPLGTSALGSASSTSAAT